MGLFEDVYNKTRDCVNIAGQKTTEIVDLVKLKMDLADLHGNVKKHYQSLGTLVYNSRKTGEDKDDAIETVIAKIDELNRKISDLEDEICKAKNSRKCPSCGEINSKDNKFCSKCGSPLDDNATDSDDDIGNDDTVNF